VFVCLFVFVFVVVFFFLQPSTGDIKKNPANHVVCSERKDKVFDLRTHLIASGLFILFLLLGNQLSYKADGKYVDYAYVVKKKRIQYNTYFLEETENPL
jgi:hypothetical protein